VSVPRATLLLLPLAVVAVAVCSHPMTKPPVDGGTTSTGGAGGFVSVDGGASGSGGLAPLGDAGLGGVIGTGGCWWMKPSGAGGIQPDEDDGWPASPPRAPGAAVARTRVDAWTLMSSAGSPSGAREGATAVWTGSEMIVWGGLDTQPRATGGRYDPATDTWKPTSTSVAPKARSGHAAVWTGTKMIVWGGYDGNAYLSSGGIYDPATDTWTATTIDGAPIGAADPRAVWTGTELIVWSANQTWSTVVSGRYRPSTDTWHPLATAGAPIRQVASSVVWTGTEMIVWGGTIADECASAQGAIYNPATDTWRPVTSVGAPHPRYGHSAVWTGTQMIIWGGTIAVSTAANGAASYDPSADAWYAITERESPSPRTLSPALFFLPDPATPGAGRMLLWGGDYGYAALTGAIYDFVPDRWDVVAPFPVSFDSANAASSRTTVWTGREMIVWDVAAGVGARYTP